MRARLAVALVVWWIVCLVWFARIPVTAPLVPAQREAFAGASFRSAIGDAGIDGQALSVTAMDDKDGVLLVRRVDIVAAERPVLRYRVGNFPSTMELALVFRRADAPGDTFSTTLTTPRGEVGTIDLATEREWRGRIVEVGFAAYAVAQSAPPATAFRPYRFLDATFESPSWRGALGATATEWFGRRYWALMSMSALGPDAPRVRSRSLILFAAAGVLGSIALAAWLGGWRERRLLRFAIVASVCAWVALDLRWLLTLTDRHAGTRAAYAGHDWRQRQALQPDRGVAAAAARVREALGDKLGQVRLLVDAPSDYERARLVYHLLPANAAPINLLVYARKNYPGVYLVTYERDASNYDAEKGLLTLLDETTEPAERLIDEPPLQLYRLRQAGAP
ncbi:hypothetical protein [Tahibacter soli]|uniref:Uncharacterized protein n=1 Tax=Tahibacter soli TaxID=2983605 RepID=A0A9X3YII3_9GAMM|nr:hypothetical protein [Tahibacter soli]MDC8011750.1 hypothetical protein [Tahibacter soli]